MNIVRRIVPPLNSLCTDYIGEGRAINGFNGVPHKLAQIESGTHLSTQGQSSRKAYVIEEGWGMRYMLLSDGRRQILNFMLAGDFFDLHCLVGQKADHSVETITPIRVRIFEPVDIVKNIGSNPALAAALLWSSLQEEGILRAQIARNGRRPAIERIAHLMLELGQRLELAGQIDRRHGDLSFRLPLTQTVLADALGLSNVHVSRSLKRLRELNLLEVRGGRARIIDPVALARFADFHPDYLHLSATPLSLRLNGAVAP